MKHFWLLVVLFAVAGFSIAWVSNYMRFGRQEARMGLLTADGEVNAGNVIDIVKAGYVHSGAKVLMLTEESYNFGVMAPGDEGLHIFRVKNDGTEPLSLKEGASTCKCTIGKLEENMLAPGEETDVKVEWTVKTNKSSFSQSAQIITNDPSKVTLNLSISGRVVRDIEIVPKMWTVGDVAAGEPFEVRGTIYNYYEHKIEPGKLKFTSKQLNALTEFEVEEFEPSEADGANQKALQGFNVTAKVKGGMGQGAISTIFQFGFLRRNAEGNYVRAADDESGDEGTRFYASAEVSGRVIGNLSMIVGAKLSGKAGGGYIYDFGKLGYKDSKKAKAFIVLKGSERDKTKLTIGEVFPAGVLQAKLGKPLKRETMVLYPIEMEIVPGDKPYDLTGKDAKAYGKIWIESDNPKVTKMRLAVKFAVDAE